MTDNAYALLAYICASTRNYKTHLLWTAGDPKVRGWFMHRDRKDWELAAILYRIERRKALR